MRVRIGGLEPHDRRAVRRARAARILRAIPRRGRVPAQACCASSPRQPRAAGPSSPSRVRALHSCAGGSTRRAPCATWTARGGGSTCLVALRDALERMARAFRRQRERARARAPLRGAGARDRRLPQARRAARLREPHGERGAQAAGGRGRQDPALRDRAHPREPRQPLPSVAARALVDARGAPAARVCALRDGAGQPLGRLDLRGREALVPPLLQLLGEMEVYLALLAFKDAAEARGSARVFARVRRRRARQDAEKHGRAPLRGPVQSAAVQPEHDADRLRSGPRRAFDTTTLLTGPNSGGKTRLLQAIALAQLLGQAGFYVPAEERHARPRARTVRLADRRGARRSERGPARHGAPAHPPAVRGHAAGLADHPRRAVLGHQPQRRRGHHPARAVAARRAARVACSSPRTSCSSRSGCRKRRATDHLRFLQVELDPRAAARRTASCRASRTPRSRTRPRARSASRATSCWR